MVEQCHDTVSENVDKMFGPEKGTIKIMLLFRNTFLLVLLHFGATRNSTSHFHWKVDWGWRTQ